MSLDCPAVTVITATRNRPDFLRAALDSMLAQSWEDFEAVVVDDGSDAPSRQAYETLWAGLDGRFRLLAPPCPGVPGTGPAAARNRGLRAARGEFIAFLDDDDIWTEPDHLAAGVAALRRCGGDYYFANQRAVRGERVVIPDFFPGTPQLAAGKRVSDKPVVVELDRRGLKALMRHHLIHVNTTLVRRDLLESVGGFWERVRFGEDYELMMRLLDRAGRVLYRPDCVARNRLPEGDSVSLSSSTKEQYLQMLCCAQHVRATCRRGLVRRMARARESWSLRQVAGHLAGENEHAAALSFAWQAVWVFPTLGAWAGLFKHLVRAAFRRRREGHP